MLTLFLTGCMGQNDVGVGPQGPYLYSAPTAIEANFVPGIPMTSEHNPYQKGETIPVSIELRNQLPEDLPENTVKLRLTGDAAIPNYFTGAREETSPRLYARDFYMGMEMPEEVDMGPITYIGDLPAKTPKTITAQYCYQVPVKVVAFLYYTNYANEIGRNLVPSSHPPSRIRISDILQYPARVREDGTADMRFRITVKNEGPGTIIESMDNCFKYRDRTERELVKLNAHGAYNIDCGDGIIRLSRDTKIGTIDCTVSGIDPSNFSPLPSQVFLTLTDFAYEENIKSVTIYLEP